MTPMAGDGGLHSRVVAVLRVALPLAALALLATLFLVSNGERRGALPFAYAEVLALLETPQMTAPRFAGVTDDGGEIRLVADSARPDPAGAGGSAARPALALTTPDGTLWTVAAGEARLDKRAGIVLLTGGVQLTSSAGWRAEAQGVAASLDRTFAETTGPARAEGPAGRIAAGRMRIDRGPQGDILVFRAGVKLVYAPGS